MSLIKRMRKQVAVLWPQASAPPGVYGQPAVAQAVEIKCRWEEKATEFLAKDGTRQISNAVVYVDRDMQLGDLLRLGPLTSLTNQVTPKKNTGVWEVRMFMKLPNLKAKEFLLVAYL